MTSRLQTILNELVEHCEKHGSYEFDYYVEIWGVMWYPWCIEVNGQSVNFSFNDVSTGDLNELQKERYIEFIEDLEDPQKEKFGWRRYRLLRMGEPVTDGK